MLSAVAPSIILLDSLRVRGLSCGGLPRQSSNASESSESVASMLAPGMSDIEPSPPLLATDLMAVLLPTLDLVEERSHIRG